MGTINQEVRLNQNILNNKLILKFLEVLKGLIMLLRNKYFYIGAITLFIGIQLNFYSQKYLLNYIQDGASLPILSDLILDNIPFWDITFLYDIFAVVSLITVITFIIHKHKYDKVPYYLLLCGIFQIIRGFFIVLTPFGNPMGFDGTDGPFNGFTDIELGVYPSGHVGITYLYFLLVRDKQYRYILLSSVLVIIIALFLSRGHYSIDILSGIFFAYAIKSYSDKHLLKYFVPDEANKTG
jgi:hypothetical protein